MTREEKIKEVLNKHFGHEVKEGSDEWYTLNYQNRFRDLDEMADWCDQHPREGLWDAEKVCKFLYEKVVDITYLNKDNTNEHYDKDEFIDDLRKAMEE